jgi:multicomponent Na+:H+ antiporter subunit F
MSTVALVAAVYLAGTLALAGVRVVRGPTAADRVLAVTLAGTTGIAILALLDGAGYGEGALLDVALVLAVLAAVPVVVYTTRVSDRR